MKKTILILSILFYFQNLEAETIVFKDCNSKNYNYEKNNYILDLEKEIMTREFIYSKGRYEKLRLKDIKWKKENKTTKSVTKIDGLIVSEVAGYPAFYTQLIFNEIEKSIKIKTVLNNTEGLSLISKCQKIEKYKKKA